MEWVFRDYGRSLKQTKYPLPYMEDVLEFDVRTNTKDLDNNIKLQGSSSDLQEKVKEVITEYWDMFCEGVFRRPIQGFLFHIYKGNHPPICCKPPKYGPRESEVMRNMV